MLCLSPNDIVHLRIKKNICSNLTIPAMPPSSMMSTLLNLFFDSSIMYIKSAQIHGTKKGELFFNENRPPTPIPGPLHMPSRFE